MAKDLEINITIQNIDKWEHTMRFLQKMCYEYLPTDQLSVKDIHDLSLDIKQGLKTAKQSFYNTGGLLDVGVPNHTDHNKRGFEPK